MKRSEFDNLSKQQQKAVIWNEGPLLLLAGPGSGKTHTITHRLLHLLNLGVSPEVILVITFTKEAALSMQRRFFLTCQKEVSIRFATFHSYFYQILKSVDSEHPCTIITSSRKRVLLHKIIESNPKIRFEHPEDADDFLENLIAAFSFYKNTLDFKQSVEKMDSEFRDQFELLFRQYQYEMQKRNLIDFDDMLYQCLKLLQKDCKLRDRWKKQFKYILIDEFQDINPMQYEMIRLLVPEPANIFAVGDDDQSIYGFRGSKPELMQKFVKDFHATVYHLDTNYRSGKEIVLASDLVIGENHNRFEKTMCCGKMNLASSVILKSFQSRSFQYEEVIQIIKNFERNHPDQKDTLAVLFRTNSYLQGMAARLSTEGIVFSMKDNCKSIYEHPIVKDICAYLQLAKGQWSVHSITRIMNKPVRFLSRDAVAESEKIDDVLGFYQCISGRGKTHAAEITAIQKLKMNLTQLKTMSLRAGIHYILKVIGYERYLKTIAHSREEKWETYQEILQWIVEDASGFSTYEEWIEAQRRYTMQLEEKQNKTQRESGKIQLMTVHSAKGLEFHTVILPDCNEKIYPNLRLPEQEALEEERRIFYVGMTRAIQELYLFYIAGTEENPKAMSRFLKPLHK